MSLDYRKRKSKYGNKKVSYLGKNFDSIGERDRYIFLKDRQARGEIRNLRCQVSCELKVNDELICRYIADFVYETSTREVVEDFKGMETAIFRLKKKLMAACLGINIHIVKKPTLPTG